MRKVRLTREMVERIERALDERKTPVTPPPAGGGERRRGTRRQTVAVETPATGAAEPADEFVRN